MARPFTNCSGKLKGDQLNSMNDLLCPQDKSTLISGERFNEKVILLSLFLKVVCANIVSIG